MKVDLVATYYKQAHLAPFFWWGVEQNIEQIENVFIVKDGFWSRDKYCCSTPDEILEENGDEFGWPPSVGYLDHEKLPHGVAVSQNQAIAASSADLIFTTSFDQILTPGTISRALEHAHPERLVTGHVHTIAEDTTLEQLPYPRVTRYDQITSKAFHLKKLLRPWSFFHNGHALIPREGHEALGGFDERYAHIGYGLEDHDYAARWARRYGLESIVLSNSTTWHFGSANPSLEERERKRPKPEAFLLLAKSLGKLYGDRWILFAKPGDRPDAVHVYQEHGPLDVVLDCRNPTWLPESVTEVHTRLSGRYLPTDKDRNKHILTILEKLHPGCSLFIHGDPDYKKLTPLSAMFGVIIDIHDGFVELSVEED